MPSTTPRISPLLVIAGAALALLLAVTASAGQSIDTDTTVDPAEPTTQDEITLTVKVFDQPAYEVRSVSVVDNFIEVDLVTVCVLAACPLLDQEFNVPLGQLPADNYLVWISLDTETVSVPLTFVVRDAGSQVPAPRFTLEPTPAVPSDNARTRMLISSEVLSCVPLALAGWERQGNSFVVRYAIGEPDPACLPVEATTLGADLLDFGQLAAGSYLVELRDADQGTLLTSRSFTVAGAGNSVDLLGRYRVSLTWKTRDGQTGSARPVALGSEESALFSFFDLGNWEVLVKVLDGCAINGNRWIFLAAATDVEFTLTVADLQGAAPPYIRTSPAGLVVPLADTAAFACTP